MSTPNTALGWATIALAAEPEFIALIQSIKKLTQKYPALTPDQIAAMITQATTEADAEFDAVIAKITADKPPAA